MEQQIKQLEEFQITFGQLCNTHPQLISLEASELRLKLMREEVKEYEIAVNNSDLKEVLDSLGDQLYILLGTVASHGLQKVLPEAFKRIHENNMTKVSKTIENAEETKEYYESLGTPCTIKRVGEYFVVSRLEDGKVLKPTNYVPVDLSDLIPTPNEKV